MSMFFHWRSFRQRPRANIRIRRRLSKAGGRLSPPPFPPERFRFHPCHHCLSLAVPLAAPRRAIAAPARHAYH